MRLIILILLAILVGFNYPEEEAIVNGKPTAHSEVTSIVALVREDGSPFCSGTLIKKDLVLTAAHCVEDETVETFKVAYKTFDPKSLNNDCFYTPAAIATHPEYAMRSVIGQRWDDVAIVRLSEEVYDAQPAPILPASHSEYVMFEGNLVLIAGYGHTDPDGDGIMALYSGKAPVIKLDTHEVIIGSPNDYAVNACKGDSGGPIYITFDNVQYVAGITSRLVSGRPSMCGHGVIYTLAGPYSDWIEVIYPKLDNSGPTRPHICDNVPADIPKINCSRCSLNTCYDNYGLSIFLIASIILAIRRKG